MKCEQDIREEELKKEGKTYFKIGRAIFVIDVLDRKQTLEETLQTPLGVATMVAGTAHKLAEDEETMKMIHGLFMPTGYLRITVEGDPDAGLGACNNEVLLTGYRYGLDDVIVDDKLLVTTHGSKAEILRQNAKFMEFASWFPRDNKKLVRRMKRISKAIENIAEDFEKSYG